MNPLSINEALLFMRNFLLLSECFQMGDRKLLCVGKGLLLHVVQHTCTSFDTHLDLLYYNIT